MWPFKKKQPTPLPPVPGDVKNVKSDIKFSDWYVTNKCKDKQCNFSLSKYYYDRICLGESKEPEICPECAECWLSGNKVKARLKTIHTYHPVWVQNENKWVARTVESKQELEYKEFDC